MNPPEYNVVKYPITDNGIGTQICEQYNMQNKLIHKSLGLEITEDRINMYNGKNGHSVKIIDTTAMLPELRLK